MNANIVETDESMGDLPRPLKYYIPNKSGLVNVYNRKNN